MIIGLKYKKLEKIKKKQNAKKRLTESFKYCTQYMLHFRISTSIFKENYLVLS